MSAAAETEKSEAAAEPHAHHRAFGRAYWMLNSIEMFERLAYFGIRAVVPLYIMQATEPGGLHLTAVHKGAIYAWWAVFQSILPIFTGGIADRYGYKRVLTFAISMNAIGYVMMANFHDYLGFFAGILVLATGTAFFKPSLQGSIAQSLTKAISSLGWGIFYWVVNVGAVAAPFVSTAILGKPHSEETWRQLFYTCAAFTCCNLLLLLTFKDVPSGASKTETPWQVLKRTVVNIVEPRLVVWLLIMSCFWLMMYQLWDLHPNFITDWIDSSSVADKFESDAWPGTLFWEYGDRGRLQVPQQILLNLNAALIVLLMVPMSWAARKMRTLSAMLVGMSVATCGVVVAGMTGSGWIFLLGVVFFSLGEMWTGPKKNEYLGLIAPPGKKALYLGYVNIPVGVGLFVGSYLAGWLYDNWGEKATLALKELGSDTRLVARAAQAADWSHSLEKIPELTGMQRAEAFARAQADLAAADPELADPQAATDRLLYDFRHDRGQITNLSYLYLAQQDEYKGNVRRGLAEALRQLADQAASPTGKPSETVALADPPGTAPATGAVAATLRKQERLLADTAGLRELAAQLDDEAAVPDVNLLARFVHRMPEWTDKKREEVFEIACEAMNETRGEDDKLGRAEVIALLWQRYGSTPGALNNLALEYLAQRTNLVNDAVARMRFPKPVDDIPDRLGIDRTRAFAALAAATGASDEQIAAALEKDRLAALNDAADQRYVYLIGRPHLRYNAVARRDWTRDIGFLRQMIENDEAALRIVEVNVDKQGLWSRITGAFARLFGRGRRDGDIFTRLAPNQDLIQKTLDAKDWSKTPAQAAYLLQLNPAEARALVAAEVGNAPYNATLMLWDKYDPQYAVWIPIAAIGVLATIALGIFGQMAKRWKDMNA